MRRIAKKGIAKVCLLSVLCMIIAAALEGTQVVWADETEETTGKKTTATVVEEPEIPEPYLVVENYELSHERIIPGVEFTLTLTVKNNSTVGTARQVLFDITNPIGVTPVYGTVTQQFLGDMKPGDSRTISYTYEAWNTITTEALEFTVSLVSVTKTNRVAVRVPTGTDNIFRVMATSGPSAVFADEAASFSLNFRVLGDENVSDVVLRVECAGETVAYSQVGSLIAGTTKTQSVSFAMSQAGTYNADFYMEYLGADGQTKSEFVGTKEFEVKKVVTETPNEQIPGDLIEEPEPDDTSAFVLTVSGVLILLIFIVSAVILKKKR